MSVILSKTDYILYRECPKNVWLKIHKPDVYLQTELSNFEKAIIEAGNEVELVARSLFPGSILIEGRGLAAQKETQNLLAKKQKVLFQPIFAKDGFFAAVDILEYNPDDETYSIYEVKSTNDIDAKTHYHDLAFQINLLSMSGLRIKKASVIHLNSEYARQGELNINKLFKTQDATEEVVAIKDSVKTEMEIALKYVSQTKEPTGFCDCVYKGRSNHCATFKHSNPQIPEYGIHDITRIGNSKAKLLELVDIGVFKMEEVPDHIEFSTAQKNQIDAWKTDLIMVDKHKIRQELDSLIFPLYFLDYETFPCAIPRFDGFSPYQHIPFQYSLHILNSENEEPEHREFLFDKDADPSAELVKSLRSNIGDRGSIIVWSKKFEKKINEEIAKRIPSEKQFIDDINNRVYDLMEIFSNQHYVHKDFRGRVSIKNILPVLVPELSYKSLEIKEGGTASQKWGEAIFGEIAEKEKQKIVADLKEYCCLDTLAMYKIWRHLRDVVS